MKKFLFIAAVSALAFFAGSCQRENLEPVAGGTTVTYTVNVPDAIATKADDGVTKLIYQVYRAAEVDDLSKDPIYDGEATLTSGTASLELEFVKNQNFKVLFWAQDPDVTAYDTEDLREVTLTPSLTANDADLAVFAGSDDVVDCVSNAGGNVSLVRPVSQINIATSPESLKVGTETSFTEVDLKKSSATVKNGLYKVYNVADKTVSVASDFEYASADVPAGTITVGTKEYTYVAMNYVGFAPETGATVDVDFTIVTSEGDIEHSVSSVPVKPNYKTNLTGNLITASDNYVITLKDTWGTPEEFVEVVSVSTAQELQNVLDNLENQPDNTEVNVKLEGNIDLGALAGLVSTKADAPTYGLLISPGKALVLDLNGCTISQTVEQTAGYSMILNKGTLTIDDSKGNGKISYTDSKVYAADNGYVSNTITNNGTLIIKGGIIENNSADNVAQYGYPYAIDSMAGSDGNDVVTNIEGGTIQSNYSPLGVRPNSADKKVVANITGGNIKGRIDFQMLSKTPVFGELNISGGSFDKYGIKNYVLLVFGAGEGTDASGMKANITGGTFNAGFSFSTALPIGSNFNKKFISGGEFSFDPSEYLADGYFATQEDSKYVVYKAVAAIGETMYKSIEDAIKAVGTSATITVLCDAEMAANAEIAEGKTVVIDLNGCTISAVDNTEKNYQIIQNKGNLTIKNSAENTAKMTVKATINSGWNRYSAVIANTVGGTLTVEEKVLLEHLGGTDMAYGIDNLTNGKGTYAVTTINGATVKSPYRAVRQFLNGIEATNELYVKAGSELRGDNKSIFFHDPSKNANTGKLVVEEGARLYGDVYLFVTAGSTEWPVEVSVAASSLAEGAEVISGNVPSGYDVINDNGTWTVVKYPSFSELVTKVIKGNGTYEGNGETYMIIPASGDARNTADVAVPNRLQKYSNPEVYYAQYQRFTDLADINISNVTITFVPAAITVIDAWNTAGATTTNENINGEIQFMNTGNVTLTNCVFNTVSVSPINALELTVTGCEFNDLMAYAIKDVKANTVINNNEFNNCNGGFWFNAAPATITAKENTFSVGRRGAIQFSKDGDYSNTSIEISGNKVEGALLWQLNPTLSFEQYKAIIDNNTYTEAYVYGSVIPAE